MSGPQSSSGPPRPNWRADVPIVRVESRERIAYMPSQPAATDPTRAQALIVVTLTMACTVLSVYDLFLLAAGLH